MSDDLAAIIGGIVATLIVLGVVFGLPVIWRAFGG